MRCVLTSVLTQLGRPKRTLAAFWHCSPFPLASPNGPKLPYRAAATLSSAKNSAKVLLHRAVLLSYSATSPSDIELNGFCVPCNHNPLHEIRKRFIPAGTQVPSSSPPPCSLRHLAPCATLAHMYRAAEPFSSLHFSIFDAF